mgnify:CR=1 FL=1
MVKSIKTSFLALALLAVAIAIPVSLLVQKIAVFIKGGLSDSKKIRVAEATACVSSSQEAHFSGCNSII